MAYKQDRPYLIIWRIPPTDRRAEFQHGWFTSEEVGNFFRNHSNPKRPKAQFVNPEDIEWLPGELIDMKMYKQEFHHDYDSIHEIFNSDSLAAQRFREGSSLNDLFWEIEW